MSRSKVKVTSGGFKVISYSVVGSEIPSLMTSFSS